MTTKIIINMIAGFLRKRWLIGTILILALLLRFLKLDSYPALNADEAAIGYNAYSLIQTGFDEHGNFWPVHFQSFNDYKPGLYFYLVLPLVKLMGLNEWAVRIPGALSGALTVLVIYLLSKELFKNEKIALVSALFLAISPWHLHFSRGGWEVNTATFFIALGALMFFRAIKNPSFVSFFLFLLPFSMSFYTYHAARIVVPLLALGLLVIYRRIIFIQKNTKVIILGSLLLVALLLPLVRDTISSNVLSRASGVGLFADKGPINRINEQRGEHGDPRKILGRALHNKIANYGLVLSQNWGAHYHGLFLFLSGDDIQRDKVPETGQMYMFDVLFVLAGIFIIIRGFSQHSKSYSFVIYWLAVAPVAAALTFQAPHALRAQNMVIPLIMIAAIGFVGMLDWFNVRNLKYGIWILAAFVIWGFARYEHLYWIHVSKEYPYSSQYGLKEMADYVSKNQAKYKDVFITDKYDQPYILLLFYTKYPPSQFQGRHTLTTRDVFGFSTVSGFDKYHFGPVDLSSLRKIYPGSLIIGTPEEIPESSNIIEKIYGSNGHEYFNVVAN